MDDVVKRIFDLMQAKDPPWDWADLARELKTTDQRLYNWRIRRVPPGEYERIADVLGVSIDTLKGRTPTPRPAPSPSGPAEPGRPPTIADLLAGLKGEIDTQPAPIREAVAKLVADYIQTPDADTGALVADAITRLVKK